MREFTRNCVALLFMLALLVGLSWAFGLGPDGLIYGNWVDGGDHPTNWYDAALHPDAR